MQLPKAMANVFDRVEASRALDKTFRRQPRVSRILILKSRNPKCRSTLEFCVISWVIFTTVSVGRYYSVSLADTLMLLAHVNGSHDVSF